VGCGHSCAMGCEGCEEVWGIHFTLGHPFLYLYIFPKFIHYLLYKPLYFLLFTFFVTVCDLLSFWPHTTHVTLGWSITSHLPSPTLSISSEYYPDHLPIPSEFVHLVRPLAQLILGLGVPTDTRPCHTVAATVCLIHSPAKGSLESSHFLTSSMYPLSLPHHSRFCEALCF
jgi:hypothetical protein